VGNELVVHHGCCRFVVAPGVFDGGAAVAGEILMNIISFKKRQALMARPDRSELVRRVAGAIRRGEIDLAEWLISEHGTDASQSAECLNLLGVIAVAEDDWRKAKRYWRRATGIEGAYQPALRNLRRYYELNEFGKSGEELCLGDEPEFSGPTQENES
jgi:hypothetical protein